MTLKFKTGNMFNEPVEAIVNTVNCVGVMGKGVALEFKHRWPENFKAYKKLCDEKKLSPGSMFVFENSNMFENAGPKFLINFPTKQHWRSKSKIEYVEKGLDAFIVALREYGIQSVALPPLGCGNGGLDWFDVRALIEKKLSGVNDINIIVFTPKEFLDNPEHDVPNFSMNFERASLLKALSELEVHFGGSFDRISLQKIVYFLQALGVDFKLSFSRNKCGPYCEELKQAFTSLERLELIAGFTSQEKMTHVTPSAYALADDFLLSRGPSLAQSIVDRLDKLIQGYESPYGLELLSSVHLLASQENIRKVDDVIKAISNWSDAKRSKFSSDVIEAAYERLSTDGLLN